MESRTIWGLTTEEWQAKAKTPFPNPLGHGTISQTLMGIPKELGVQKAQVTIPVPSYQRLPVIWRARQDSRPGQSQQAEGSGRGVLKRLWVSRVKMGMFCPGTWRFSLKGDRMCEPGLCRLYRILYVCHAGTWADLASLARCQAHTNTHTAAPCVQPLAPGHSMVLHILEMCSRV